MRSLLAMALAAALAGPAGAQTYHRVEVTDGDTVIVRSSGMVTGFRVRVLGGDTPELNGRCPEERAKAQEARDALIRLVAPGVEVRSGLETDRYGRILARLYTRDGRDVMAVLIEQGLAHPYDGKGPRPSWCAAQ